MQNLDYKAALGIPLGSFNPQKFAESCIASKFFIPVYTINDDFTLQEQFNQIIFLKYKAIKIHPRSNNWIWGDINFSNLLNDVAKFALKNNYLLIICTYCATNPTHLPISDPIYILSEIMRRYPLCKILLTHGGFERIMSYAELCRFSDNVKLDLSYSIPKLIGSSIEQDIRYLLNNFEKKITVGTDWPFVKPQDVFSFYNTVESGEKNISAIFGSNISDMIF